MGNSISGGEFDSVIQAETVNLYAGRSPVHPAGLPPRSLLVGREQHLAELQALLAPDGAPVTALVGLGGVGKTTLAVEAAHRAQNRFTGGVHFLDLHGYDDSRLSPARALDTLLHSLGEDTPPDRAAKEQAYRSSLAALDGPALVVADNASSAEQIAPLVPADPRHRLLVTSRHLLVGRTLAPHHLSVGVLTGEAAVSLLPECDEAAELARLCGYLPLALRIVAALLETEPDRTPAELMADLTDTRERLSELDLGPDLDVRATFELSYRNLPGEQARLFALLAANPGPDLGLPAATALADRTERETARLLRGLRRAHLIESTDKRYRFHDLVRLYAAECPADDPGAALRRLLDHYVRVVLVQVEIPGSSTPWIEAELTNLLAAGHVSRDLGLSAHTYALLSPLKGYLLHRRRLAEMIHVGELALTAVRQLGQPAAESEEHYWLGLAHAELADYDAALAAFEAALAIDRESGDRGHQAAVLVGLGGVHGRLGAYEDALGYFQQALALGHTTTHEATATALVNVGAVLRRLDGSPDEVLAHFTASLALVRGSRDRAELHALHGLADLLVEQGRPAEALAHLHECRQICRELGNRYLEAQTLLSAVLAHNHLEQWTQAVIFAAQAAAAFEEVGADAEAAPLRAILASVPKGATDQR